MSITLYGSEGVLHYDLDNDRLRGASRHSGAASARMDELGEIPIPPEKAGGWQVEADWVRSIREGTPVRFTDFATGVAYMEFTEAVARSARTERAPARLRQRRLADALGAAPYHDSAVAVPQTAHSPLLLRVGPGPPCTAPRHLPVTARLRASPNTHPTTAAVGLRLPSGGIRYQRAPAYPTAADRPTSRLLVGVSRTESSLYRDRSGGFVHWHPACVSLNPFANHPSAPSREPSFHLHARPHLQPER